MHTLENSLFLDKPLEQEISFAVDRFAETYKEVFTQVAQERKQVNPDQKVSVPGWNAIQYSSRYDHHLTDASFLLAKNIPVIENLKLLDLGAGSGRALNFLSYYFNIETWGVEFSPVSAQTTEKVSRRLEKVPGFEHTNAHCVSGNFFPSDFEVPDEVKWGEVEESEREKYTNDPYELMGKDFASFDIFYFYQFEFNTQWVLNLLSERAKKGAYILFADFGMYENNEMNIPGNLELIEQRGRVALFQVQSL